MEPLDWKQTILSQYADSKVLKSLISGFADAMRIDREWCERELFNQFSAQKPILRIIAERYGLNATLKLKPLMENHDFIMDSDIDGYAFETPTQDGGTFDIKQEATEQYITLQNSDLLNLIYANAARATLVPSVANLNRIVKLIFNNRGNCWIDISDIADFIITWKFEFALTNQEKQLVQNGYLSFISGYEFKFDDNITGV